MKFVLFDQQQIWALESVHKIQIGAIICVYFHLLFLYPHQLTPTIFLLLPRHF